LWSASNHEELRNRFKRLQRARQRDPARSLFGRAGKLWGQMAELPSYLDRATADTATATTAHS